MTGTTIGNLDVANLRRGERLPDAYLAQHRRKRVITALAKCLADTGYRYQDATVADIVRTARTARNTFYDAFGGKDAAALALVVDVFPNLGALLGPGDIDTTSAGTLAVELAAAKVENPPRFAGVRAAGLELLDLLAVKPAVAGEVTDAADPTLCTLPPGRHGLPAEFVRENQRHRLLTGYAAAIADRGYHVVTIADITAKAQVSRRTFYEHFSDKRDLDPLLLEGLPDVVASLDELRAPSPGLVSVTLDILGAELAGDEATAADRRLSGSAVLDAAGEGGRA